MSTTTAYITEHYPVTDVFVDELAKIGRLGLVARLTFTVVMPDCCNPTEGPTRQLSCALLRPPIGLRVLPDSSWHLPATNYLRWEMKMGSRGDLRAR
jgi:hypothetical protein